MYEFVCVFSDNPAFNHTASDFPFNADSKIVWMRAFPLFLSPSPPPHIQLIFKYLFCIIFFHRVYEEAFKHKTNHLGWEWAFYVWAMDVGEAFGSGVDGERFLNVMESKMNRFACRTTIKVLKQSRTMGNICFTLID